MALATGIGIQALVDRYGEAWNAHDLDLIMSFHAEDGTYCLHADRERARGTDEIREAFGSYFTEWPDIHFERRRLLVGDGFFVHEMLVTATVDGRSVAFPMLDVITVRDGEVVDKDTYCDVTMALRQAAS
jgi:hypothetical protein